MRRPGAAKTEYPTYPEEMKAEFQRLKLLVEKDRGGDHDEEAIRAKQAAIEIESDSAYKMDIASGLVDNDEAFYEDSEMNVYGGDDEEEEEEGEEENAEEEATEEFDEEGEEEDEPEGAVEMDEEDETEGLVQGVEEEEEESDMEEC